MMGRGKKKFWVRISMENEFLSDPSNPLINTPDRVRQRYSTYTTNCVSTTVLTRNLLKLLTESSKRSLINGTGMENLLHLKQWRI